MKRNIADFFTGAGCTGLLACLTLAQPSSANAMALANHIDGLGDLGGMANLIGTPASEGGVGTMTRDQLVGVSQWMDNPALKTGQYRNQLAGGELLRPANHNYLRHNPPKVAKVFSGDGSINEGALNAARTHTIQDIAHNTQPVDGWEITPQLREEAKEILRYVDKNGKLPEKLPAWVDKRGPLIKTSEITVEETPSGIGKASKAVAGVGLVAGGVQAFAGVQELKHGQTGKGIVNTGSGAASITASGAALAGKVALSGAAMTVAAGIDGGCDLYDGIKNNKPEKTISGTVKSSAALAMGVGLATGQPEVVVPAVIVYGGAVVTDVAYENREIIGDAVYATTEATKESAANCYAKTKSGLSTAAETCADAAGPIQEKLDATASIIYERGQELHDWLF